jgi:hypothetical protein
MQDFSHLQQSSGFPYSDGYENFYAGAGAGDEDARAGIGAEWLLYPTILGPPMVAKKAYDWFSEDGGGSGGGGRQGGGGGGSGGGRGPRGGDWSGVAKVGLLVGGALAIFFFYRASKAAEPVARRLGNVATKMVTARGLGSSGGFSGGSSGGSSGSPIRAKLLSA